MLRSAILVGAILVSTSGAQAQASSSVPHATGAVTGDTLRFEFAHADGPFRRLAGTKRWLVAER